MKTKNLFTITDLERDKTEEIITFNIQVKHESELIEGQIKYELKKGIETELTSFSGLNDSHGYTEFTTFDLILDAETMKFYCEIFDQYLRIDRIMNKAIKQTILDVYSLRPDFNGWDAVCHVDQEIFDAVDDAVGENISDLLEGES